MLIVTRQYYIIIIIIILLLLLLLLQYKCYKIYAVLKCHILALVRMLCCRFRK